jgi:hypothetical protein
MDVLVFAAFFFGALASAVTRRVDSSLEGRAHVSMGSPSFYQFAGLLGAVGLIAAFVASFFVLTWWLSIALLLGAGIVAGWPAYLIGQNIENAAKLAPFLNVIAAALAGFVIASVFGYIELEMVMFD